MPENIDQVVLIGNQAHKPLTDFAMKDELTDLATKGEVEVSGTAPDSDSAAGTKGQVVVTEDYIYICVATDTWKRADLSTWT